MKMYTDDDIKSEVETLVARQMQVLDNTCKDETQLFEEWCQFLTKRGIKSRSIVSGATSGVFATVKALNLLKCEKERRQCLVTRLIKLVTSFVSVHRPIVPNDVCNASEKRPMNVTVGSDTKSITSSNPKDSTVSDNLSSSLSQSLSSTAKFIFDRFKSVTTSKTRKRRRPGDDEHDSTQTDSAHSTFKRSRKNEPTISTAYENDYKHKTVVENPEQITERLQNTIRTLDIRQSQWDSFRLSAAAEIAHLRRQMAIIEEELWLTEASSDSQSEILGFSQASTNSDEHSADVPSEEATLEALTQDRSTSTKTSNQEVVTETAQSSHPASTANREQPLSPKTDAMHHRDQNKLNDDKLSLDNVTTNTKMELSGRSNVPLVIDKMCLERLRDTAAVFTETMSTETEMHLQKLKQIQSKQSVSLLEDLVQLLRQTESAMNYDATVAKLSGDTENMANTHHLNILNTSLSALSKQLLLAVEKIMQTAVDTAPRYIVNALRSHLQQQLNEAESTSSDGLQPLRKLYSQTIFQSSIRLDGLPNPSAPAASPNSYGDTAY